jgi:hypothetical protein
VDLWDLTKLLLRRWYFALPLLLLSVAMVFLAAKTVEPDYSANGYLQLIPPPGSAQPEDPEAKPRPRNPWLDLGYEALGTAAKLKVLDKAGLERLVNSGLTDNVTVEMSGDSPLFEIEVIGVSADQATATVREIIRQLEQNVEASQKQYGVYPEDTITTLTLDDGRNVEVVTTKIKRILIVAAGIGVLFTAGATIGLDALLRRRGRRQLGYQDTDLLGAGGPPPTRMPDLAHPPAPAPPGPGISRRDWMDNELGSHMPGPSPVLSLPAAPTYDRPRVSFEVPGPAVPSGPPAPSAPPAARPYAEADGQVRPSPYLAPQRDLMGMPPAGPQPPVPAHEVPVDDDPPIPSDATIVLPLAYLSKRDDRNSK